MLDHALSGAMTVLVTEGAFARLPDRRRVLNAAGIPELVKSVRDVQLRFDPDIALVDLAVIADMANDASSPVLGEAEILAIAALTSLPTSRITSGFFDFSASSEPCRSLQRRSVASRMNLVKAEAQLQQTANARRRYAGPTFERMSERANFAISQQPGDFRGAKAEKSGGYNGYPDRQRNRDQDQYDGCRATPRRSTVRAVNSIPEMQAPSRQEIHGHAEQQRHQHHCVLHNAARGTTPRQRVRRWPSIPGEMRGPFVHRAVSRPFF
jgi:hypothetical protein